MRYTKALDELLRRRVALQHELDGHHNDYLSSRRKFGDIRRELSGVDKAIAAHVEGGQ